MDIRRPIIRDGKEINPDTDKPFTREELEARAKANRPLLIVMLTVFSLAILVVIILAIVFR